MKQFKNILGAATLTIAAALLFVSCTKENINGKGDPDDGVKVPTAEAYMNIKNKALNSRIQHFKGKTGGIVEFTSASGVKLQIFTYSLKINGRDVTPGDVDFEFIELYNAGDMLVTNKRTMGKDDNGDLDIIKTGGAFYLNGYKDGQQLDKNSVTYQMVVPGDLTGGIDTGMILWNGELDDFGNMTWNKDDDADNGQQKRNSLGFSPQTYEVLYNQFGWVNIDRFFNDPHPKTDLWVRVPNGYDWTNANVYLKVKGEPNALASLDVYDTAKHMFTEHYGRIPIGLECHLIFVSENNGSWRVAIRSVEIEEDHIYQFTILDTEIMNENDLVSTIDALP